MKISVALPTTGPTASPQSIAETARQAEAANLHRLWTVDRLLRPADGTAYVDEHYKCAFDPIETLAWVAARTSKIGLGTSIVLLPFPEPGSPCKTARNARSSVGRPRTDRSRTRTYAAGVRGGRRPRTERGRASRKASPRCAQPGDPDPVEFRGHFTHIPLADIGPKPLRAGGVPVIIGGESDVAVRRAGRLGVGINPILQERSALRCLIDVWRSAAEGAGVRSRNSRCRLADQPARRRGQIAEQDWGTQRGQLRNSSTTFTSLRRWA